MRTEVPAGSTSGVPSGIWMTRASRWVRVCSLPFIGRSLASMLAAVTAWTWHRECYRSAPMPPVLLARLADIPEGGMTGRVHGSHEIALARVRGEVFAMDDVCT